MRALGDGSGDEDLEHLDQADRFEAAYNFRYARMPGRSRFRCARMQACLGFRCAHARALGVQVRTHAGVFGVQVRACRGARGSGARVQACLGFRCTHPGAGAWGIGASGLGDEAYSFRCTKRAARGSGFRCANAGCSGFRGYFILGTWWPWILFMCGGRRSRLCAT